MYLQSLAALAATGLMTAGAQGALISFAADSNPNEPTLLSQFDAGSKITSIFDRGPTMLELLTDPDEDGPLGPVFTSVAMSLGFTMEHVDSRQIFPGFWSHTFSVVGDFEFRDVNTDELLYRGATGEGGGVFVGLGSATKIMSGSISAFDATYDIGALGAAIVGFGGTNLLGDFGFTLTSINNGSGAMLAFENGDVVGIQDFIAESSFSGSFIPTPGFTALASIAGLVALRRRRDR
ncbi:MAG: hypothetical protein EA379_01970 [Phycisphaerales bacterium]|nr:MAG: hypothetical protein EA379_01970 [Phycisphaerales bacterium]